MNEKTARYTCDVQPYCGIDAEFILDNNSVLDFDDVADLLNSYEARVTKYRKALEEIERMEQLYPDKHKSKLLAYAQEIAEIALREEK